MKIRAGYRITLDCVTPTPMLLLLSVHPDRRQDLLTPDQVNTSIACPVCVTTDPFGNLLTRVTAPRGKITFSSNFIIHDSGEPDLQNWTARQVDVSDLPTEVLQYLLGSRYCETDRLSDLAWSRFGGVHPGWGRVQAIVDYVHDRISFGYRHARATRTALDAHDEQVGVCRDFAHLAIALCRAMNIPARYCTGYLGDIGIPPVDAEMDFSAWFEVYLEGGWYTFDARHNKPRIGRIVIARGRDAMDTAITHSFGTAILNEFQVVTNEESSDQTPTSVSHMIAAQ